MAKLSLDWRRQCGHRHQGKKGPSKVFALAKSLPHHWHSKCVLSLTNCLKQIKSYNRPLRLPCANTPAGMEEFGSSGLYVAIFITFVPLNTNPSSARLSKSLRRTPGFLEKPSIEYLRLHAVKLSFPDSFVRLCISRNRSYLRVRGRSSRFCLISTPCTY